MSIILSFVNQKGGVGKTTSVINIARSLAESHKVLIIDMDPQGNASQVYCDITDTDDSVYSLLMKDQKAEAITQSTYFKNIDILPANVLLSSAELELVSTHGRETVLKRKIAEQHSFFSAYDFILIDCPPSLGLLTINAIMASQFTCVPLKADVFSLTGLELLTNTIQSLQDALECNTTILGFFFTESNRNESMFKESFSLCKQTYDNLLFDIYISDCSTIDHANAMGQSVIDFNPQSQAAKDYLKLSHEITQRAR